MPLLSEVMTGNAQTNWPDWPAVLQRINHDLTALNQVERDWLQERLAVIDATQLALDALFCKVGGADACAGCDGACCACGRHHITLTNLLAYLLQVKYHPPRILAVFVPTLASRAVSCQ